MSKHLKSGIGSVFKLSVMLQRNWVTVVVFLSKKRASVMQWLGYQSSVGDYRSVILVLSLTYLTKVVVVLKKIGGESVVCSSLNERQDSKIINS